MAFVPAGTYAPPDADTESKLYAAAAQLRAEAQEAFTTIAGTPQFPGSNGGEQAGGDAQGYIQRANTLGYQISNVEAGEWSSKEWFIQAGILHDSIAYNVKSIGDWGFYDVGAAVVVATGQDVAVAAQWVADKAKDAVEAVTNPWWIWGVAALGILWVFGPELRAAGKSVA